MNSYFSKICEELKKVALMKNNAQKSDCVIFANDYKRLKNEVQKLNLSYFEYPFISAIGVSLNQKDILKFAKANSVQFISTQTKVSTQIDTSKKILNLKPFYERKIYGENTTLAVIDTGINPHLDFLIPENRIIKFVDLINNIEGPYDDNGHGTFVTSLACGNGFASGRKYAGISPKSKIISIKALEKNGETGAYKILEAMQWICDNYKKYNIKVVCMSFGSTPLGRNDPLVVGAESLWNRGIIVVAAAGNSGPDNYTIKSPGFSSKIITVGGIDDKRNDMGEFDFSRFEIAKFSSRGPAGNFFKPDLVAPAVNITGAKFNREQKTFYVKMSGTSVSTPIIAGICLLICSKYPNITNDQVKIRLLNSCTRINKNRNDEGYGILNLNRFFG